MDLSNSHIKYVLGIDINLNENITCSNLNQIIIQEQLLYETFLDTIKNYAGDKFNQTIDKIKEWKDAAAVIGQILSSPELLDDFLSPLYRMVGKAVKTISNILKKMNLNDFSKRIMGFVEKIRSLKGWKKFMALVSLGSIATYINKKIKSFSPASLVSFFSENLAEDFLETISDKLTDWKTYLGYLEPIVDGVQTIYEFLQPLLSQFSKALKSGAKAGSLAIKLIKENMEQQQLRQIIREHIKTILMEGDNMTINDLGLKFIELGKGMKSGKFKGIDAKEIETLKALVDKILQTSQEGSATSLLQRMDKMVKLK